MEDYNEDGKNITDEEYFYEVFNTMSEDIISDEYFDKNKALIIDISNSLHEIYSRTGKIPPNMAKRIIGGFFSAIKRNGIR
jgi:hypothetical protein